MQKHHRNPRYLSIPTLTASLFSSYIAGGICDAYAVAPVTSGLIYMSALVVPIIIKRRWFTQDDAWVTAHHSRHYVSRLP